MDMKNVTGVSKMFVKWKEDVSKQLFMAKVTDEPLLSGTILDMHGLVRMT